ncbi:MULTISPECIES: metal ABC transporter solute-binding protein, Zn/Mn family [unclassified Oceanobacter]|jgi:zinc transport system substrate-binding protein|uniref:metal ABC transporter solute-binding protein, Zn/Mn family n=1 Tax=unclassified Oceanobacter TaxID=2620260 RepID=UPI0026E12896|nr:MULTISPECIES: zinc ABC transporter substrate-binding protein [unclassified Oceanobacter]MDO6680908.1 zinc ABC transporter substrate-binding protein [Oceanobacter sp. 5_MG-2023]MDP2546873.1 zinc ABC transporter substrate-binding protein [Oceanobacter sp. 4_MG-2023]
MNKVIFLLLLVLLGASTPAFAAADMDDALTSESRMPSVLASVHPLALVAASVVPAERLNVLVPPGMTPHDFALRPSDIDLIQNADIILWAGPVTEPYLKGFANRWPDKIWINVAELGQDSPIQDPHWWLSPSVMKLAQQQLAEQVGRDSATFAAAVDLAVAESRTLLAPVRQRGFFVFHRAYDHWVAALGLNQVGYFTLSPEQKPGIRTLQTMRSQLMSGEVVCVFSEPEFSPALVDRIVEGITVGRGELDPMGLQVEIASDAYPALLMDMAHRARTCLEAVAMDKAGVLEWETEIDKASPGPDDPEDEASDHHHHHESDHHHE